MLMGMNQHTTKNPAEQLTNTPGREHEMQHKPKYDNPTYKGSGKLKGKVALITGGDSGIGRAVAILYAREGASVAIGYLEEHDDARETKRLLEQEGGHCEIFAGDISRETWCQQLVDNTVDAFGRLDIVVNNAGEQHVKEGLEQISAEQWQRTFGTDVNGMFYTSKAALEHLPDGGTIINTASVVAYKGHPVLIDYASAKGAVIAFTRALALNVAPRGIRVNAVAPGPIWTPLIPSTFPSEKVQEFGRDVPLGRPGQPAECAPAYVFLATSDSSYITGQTIHINGGSVVNG